MPLAVQVLAAQQGCDSPPQATHVLLEQIDPLAQMFPQQGWVAAPQATQVLLLVLQVAPELQIEPQQGCVAPPQAVQRPPEQTLPEAQFDPAQQG